MQIENFLVTILSGILMGLLFDGYRVLRGFINPKILVTDIGDLLFWLFMTSMVFSILVLVNWGEMRLYVFVGLGIGFALYARYLSRPVILLLIRVWDCVSNVIQYCGQIMHKYLWKPLVWLCNLLIYPFCWLYITFVCRVVQSGHRAGKRCKQIIIKRWFRPKDPPI